MFRRFYVWSAVLLTVVAALPHGQLRADGDRPFRGTAAGAVTEAVPPNELVIRAAGAATHLGQFAREEHLFLNPDGSFTGTIVFTAANGDELWADFSGAFTSATAAAGAYTFTGGTGRFKGATGAAAFAASTPDGVHVEVTFEGTVRY